MRDDKESKCCQNLNCHTKHEKEIFLPRNFQIFPRKIGKHWFTQRTKPPVKVCAKNELIAHFLILTHNHNFNLKIVETLSLFRVENFSAWKKFGELAACSTIFHNFSFAI